ncbi:hypothetical protein PRZ48_003609 [Zasmidium cellare]|uniref:Uncharacterized protein n=1 Tax=Zasmidium cellare TaxID=395010 RepID=A0ABR0EVJ3_ZASCE|nr:hypothetical protein PRZ48_003609 [Zasmidium cellare]
MSCDAHTDPRIHGAELIQTLTKESADSTVNDDYLFPDNDNDFATLILAVAAKRIPERMANGHTTVRETIQHWNSYTIYWYERFKGRRFDRQVSNFATRSQELLAKFNEDELLTTDPFEREALTAWDVLYLIEEDCKRYFSGGVNAGPDGQGDTEDESEMLFEQFDRASRQPRLMNLHHLAWCIAFQCGIRPGSMFYN